jgi:hypothetical protein
MRNIRGFPLWTYFGIIVAVVSLAVSTVMVLDARSFGEQVKDLNARLDAFAAGQRLQDFALLDIHMDIQKLFDAIFGTGGREPVPRVPQTEGN